VLREAGFGAGGRILMNQPLGGCLIEPLDGQSKSRLRGLGVIALGG